MKKQNKNKICQKCRNELLEETEDLKDLLLPLPEEDIKAYKSKKAMVFALWLSMPFIFHEQSALNLEKMGYDVKDKTFNRLLGCRTKTDFAEEFNVSRRTLFNWERNKNIRKYVDKFNKLSNVIKFKKDIDFAFTKKTIEKADASRVKLWKQLYEGWKETNVQEISEIKSFSKEIKKLAEKR